MTVFFQLKNKSHSIHMTHTTTRQSCDHHENSPYERFEKIPQNPDEVGWVDDIQSLEIFLVPMHNYSKILKPTYRYKQYLKQNDRYSFLRFLIHPNKLCSFIIQLNVYFSNQISILLPTLSDEQTLHFCLWLKKV